MTFNEWYSKEGVRITGNFIVDMAEQFGIIAKYAKEAQQNTKVDLQTATNNARDVICPMCKNDSFVHQAMIKLLTFKYCPACGDKLTPVA